jgi:hypothetical protein
MADKEIVAEITRRRAGWPALINGALHDALGEGEVFRDELPGALAAAIDAIAADLRGVAELYGKARMRGAKGEIDELTAAAGPVEQPSRGGPAVPAEWCGDPADHSPHTWRMTAEVGNGPAIEAIPGPMRECLGRRERDLSGLRALVAGRAGLVGITPAVAGLASAGIASDAAIDTAVRAGIVSAGAEAYLRGQASDIPGSAPLGPGSVTSAPELGNPFERSMNHKCEVIPVLGPVRMTRQADGSYANAEPISVIMAANATRDPFDDPAPVGWANEATSSDGYRLPGNVPPAAGDLFDEPARRGQVGRKISWGDLRDLLGKNRVGAGLPEHLSHSQMTTLAECGLKYLGQRDEQLGVVEIPQWALIGGNAFHAAVEWFENVAVEVGQLQHVKDRLQVFRDEHGGRDTTAAEALWSWAFGAQITETALKSPVPQDEWRSSKQGMEGYTWWLVNGGDMVQRYLDARLLEIGGPGWRKIRFDRETTGPMIEWEYITDVEGVPFKGIIDQVWEVTEQRDRMAPGDLLIDDCKSGAKVGGDTAQLGEYALWLSRFGGGENRKIWGRFYDARKGTWTAPVDLLAVHPWDELAARVVGADLAKRGGVFMPHRSNFCGGCSIKHACPLFATQGA